MSDKRTDWLCKYAWDAAMLLEAYLEAIKTIEACRAVDGVDAKALHDINEILETFRFPWEQEP